MKERRLTGRLLVVVALVLLGGCGPRSGGIPISGDVTFDGQPVMDGSIVLEPADGKGQSTGCKIVDGRYDLSGEAAPLPGKKKVRILGVRKTGRTVQIPMAPPGTMGEETERYIPKIYNRNTTLVCEVSKDGERQIDFNLNSQSGKR